MTDSIWMLYLFTRLDAIVTFFHITALLCFIGVFAGAMFWSIENSKNALLTAKISAGVMPFAVIGALLMPSQKDAMFILAGTGVIEAVKTDTAKRIAGKSVEVVEKALDEYLKKGGK